ncbi:hypothetical protein [Streptomyces microflavus]|uniref:hypothetical protein n=1 Tax=Streptomyces microflavus TaxID=1919 RepID=UPI003826A090
MSKKKAATTDRPLLHAVLTIEYSAPQSVQASPGAVTITDGTLSRTGAWTIQPRVGATRDEIYLESVLHMRKEVGISEDAPLVVRFWSLKKNDIS